MIQKLTKENKKLQEQQNESIQKNKVLMNWEEKIRKRERLQNVIEKGKEYKKSQYKENLR
jgi:hypothetical protein